MDADDKLLERLAFISVDLHAEAEPCEQVFRDLAKQSGLEILPLWESMSAAGIERDKEISLSIRGTSLKTALELTLRLLGGGETELGFEVHGQIVIVGTAEELARRTFIRVYDVEDLLAKGDQSARAEIHIGGGPETCFGISGASKVSILVPKSMPGLMNMLLTVITPECWRENGGNIGIIWPYGHSLVITQTATAHQQIRQLLTELRTAVAQRDLQAEQNR